MNTIKIRDNVYEVLFTHRIDDTIVAFQAVRRGEYGCDLLDRFYHSYDGEWYVDENHLWISYTDIEKIRA